MRNLKKILALVLALVMSLSLVTIANAADFTDNDDISYEEAADVMSAIGIIEGFEDGSFDPDGTLTREQAAALVTRMLLGDNADNLGIDGSTFNDVLTTRWSAPAIEYCASLGLIDGAGDGNFYPAGQLTANAFAKILLTALGYDSQKEQMTGASWSVNVAALAMEVGLDDGIEGLSWSAVLTREEAAQMALNAIQAPLVAYDNDATVTVNGAEVAIGGSDYYYITTTLAREQRISKQTLSNTGEYTVEFGERYFPNLRLTADTDVFDRPSHTWTYETEEIGTYVDYETLVETYTTGVTGRNLYDLIGSTVIKEYDVAYYVDGHENDNIQASNMIRTNTVTYEETGNGVLTQVFVDHDAEEITITSINTYIAFADDDYNEKRGEIDFTIYADKKEDDGTNATVEDTIAVEDIPAIADIADGDALLVNLAETDALDYYEVVKITDPEMMADVSLTKFSKEKYLVTGGEQYDYAEKGYLYNADPLQDYAGETDSLKGYTYNVYLDQYGYVIGTEEATGEANYLFLTGYDRPVTHLGIKTAEAAAIFLDGTMSEIEVNVTKSDKNIEGVDGYHELGDINDDWMSRYNRWFTYSTDSDGVYTLKPVNNWLNVKYTSLRDTINPASVRLNGDSGYNKLDADGDDDGRDRAYGNDDSVYITVDTAENDYNSSIISKVNGVYTGVQNVDIKIKQDTLADVDHRVAESVFAVYDDDLYVIGAVVIGEDENNTKNYAYGIDNEAMNEYIEEDDDYYYWDFEAVVDGEIVTLTVKDAYGDVIDEIRDAISTGDDETFVGAMLELTYDVDGYVVDAEVLDDDTDGVYGNDEYTDRDIDEDEDRVYLVDVKDIEDLYTTGKTLYVHYDADDEDADYGVTIDANAPVIIIQEVEDEDGDRVEVEVESYSDFKAALKALAYEEAFKGQIAAVLNSKGTAEYVVLNSARPDGVITEDDSVSGNGSVDWINYAFSGGKCWIAAYDKHDVKVDSDVEIAVYQLRDNGYVRVETVTIPAGSSLDVTDILVDGETYQFVCGDVTKTVVVDKT